MKGLRKRTVGRNGRFAATHFFIFAIAILSCTTIVQAQSKATIIDKEDLLYLQELTKAVLDSSRIHPGQKLPDPFGANNTGARLIRPGGRDTYPAFWIRDYAMSLETGFVTKAEQKHMLMLTAATQCDQTWITKGGSMVPVGSIADHIRVENSIPVYFPGTYDVIEQGTEDFGRFPPYCDQFYFIKMAYQYVKTTGDAQLLSQNINGTKLIDRLEMAFRMPPARKEDQLVYTTENFRAVDFGFRDAIRITGSLLYASLLKYDAANELSSLFGKMGNKQKSAAYKKIAAQLKAAIPTVFSDKDGMLIASTGKSAQRDVWGTALAVYLGVLDGAAARRASEVLATAYEKGNLAYKGNIRHIIKGDDYNDKTAWEAPISADIHNRYQNGAYWGTPVGWVAYTIALTNNKDAKQLVKEYIDDLKETDHRKGPGFSGPMECFYPPSYSQGPIYLTTVSCPYIVFKSEK